MRETILLSSLESREKIALLLKRAGTSSACAEKKSQLFHRCGERLREVVVPDDAAVHLFFVPGRIEVLGKHTDYGGGRSLVTATDLGFCLVAVSRDDSKVRAIAVADGEIAEFAIDRYLEPEMGSWTNYPMTVARRIARNFPGPLRGADIAFASDLPPAAGMSSSSAMMIAFFKGLAAVNNLEKTESYRQNIDSAESLAEYLGTVENGQTFGSLVGDKGVGTFGGSEDHTGILCSRPGALGLYSYSPTRVERKIELPEDLVFVVAASGVLAEKTGQALEKYNRVSLLVSAIVRIWNESNGRSGVSLAAALDSAPEAAEKIRTVLRESKDKDFSPEDLLQRFDQFAAESEEIIPAAVEALSRGDIEGFGDWVDRSQAMAEELLGNQIPETIHLAREARELGAAAASAFGAGFGGSVWALVRADQAESFLVRWAERYGRAFPEAAQKATFVQTRSGPAAFEVVG